MQAARILGPIAVLLSTLFALSLAVCEDKPGKRAAKADRSSLPQHTFQGSNDQEITYGLFVPTDVKEGTKLPLVLCLHGAGGNSGAAKLLSSDTRQVEHPCFVMAPHCDSQVARWVKFDFGRRPEARAVEPELIEALDDVIAAHPIDADRIYVTGQSMGGFGTWGLIAHHPEKFAAAVPICGGGSPEDAAKIKDVPVWAFHGAKDPTVPVKFSQDMIAALKEAGASPKYTEYPDAGHNSWSEAYDTAAMWDWMFEQRRKGK